MPSTSTFRIPKAEITGLFGALMRRYGARKLGRELPVAQPSSVVASTS